MRGASFKKFKAEMFEFYAPGLPVEDIERAFTTWSELKVAKREATTSARRLLARIFLLSLWLATTFFGTFWAVAVIKEASHVAS